MQWRSALTRIALFLFTAFTLAQDGALPQGADCKKTRPPPEGQSFDTETRTCIVLSS